MGKVRSEERRDDLGKNLVVFWLKSGEGPHKLVTTKLVLVFLYCDLSSENTVFKSAERPEGKGSGGGFGSRRVALSYPIPD